MEEMKQYKSALKDYLSKSNYIRVIRIAKTPGYDEFSQSSLRVLVAIFIVGLLGFIIFELMSLIPMGVV